MGGIGCGVWVGGQVCLCMGGGCGNDVNSIYRLYSFMGACVVFVIQNKCATLLTYIKHYDCTDCKFP